MKYFSLLLIFSILIAQTEPIENLHSNKPGTWTIINAMIHTSPNDFIKGGSINIRNGKIEAVGRYIKTPKDSYVIDLKGAHVYAGFIESWLETKSLKKTNSLRQHWDEKVRPEYRSIDNLSIKVKKIKELRNLGFTNAHLIPDAGIFRGQSGIINLSDKPKPIKSSVAQVIDFKYKTKGRRTYPRSLLGIIAHIRQTFYDANWYIKAQKIYEDYPNENTPLSSNIAFESLGISQSVKKPFIFITADEHYSNRAINIANEFSLNSWIKGSGYEYRRLDLYKETKPFFIIPIDFPSKPSVIRTHSHLQYSTEELKHWDMAPDNLKYLSNAGLEFSITSDNLKKKSQFRVNLRKMIDRGLDQSTLLAALTTIPAAAIGMDKSLGKIAPGYDANLVIVDGEYFDPKSKILSVWVNGEKNYISSNNSEKFQGTWSLKYNGSAYELKIEKPNKQKLNDKNKSNLIPSNSSYIGSLKLNEKSITINNIGIFDNTISFTVDGTKFKLKGTLSFSGDLENGKISGVVNNHLDNPLPFLATIKKTEKKSTNKLAEEPSPLSVFYPEGSYGLIKETETPYAVLINDATIWTCGPKGTLQEWDILCVDGKIKQVAPDIRIPQGSAVVIEGAGKHVTPGLIDCHSHSAASSINEGSQYITSEVRMQDVLNADDINIYRQLAGGLTTANVLHGSANPIGGQNAVIKLRWSKSPNELLFKDAPQGIKFALGENVKQANWTKTNRYPQTRMGVEQVIRDAFRAALDYKHENENYFRNSKLQRTKIPPRKDLELEAIVEILEGTRLVHCHSYRQDEILMLTRIAEDFGFTIATFQHVLEGYKIAERISEHGAGASTFSDWWQYKLEVIDAIPHNAALMTKNDVIVSINSDDSELARRLNTEAAKSIKYGNLDPHEALKLVTINPAKQLQIDKWVGSLEVGKDADFVIWDGEPLSIYSHVEETWIDGARYFSKKENQALEERDYALRKELIQKILSSTDKNSGRLKNNKSLNQHNSDFHCDTIDETGIYK